MRPYVRRVLGVTLFACLILAACARSPESKAVASSVKPAKDRRNAPDFALKDPDGRTVRLSDYRGKVVLLNFWATWCAPCRFEIPWLIDFEQQHKTRGFAVIGVAMDDEGWDAVTPFMRNLKINYRIVLGTDMTAQLFGGVEAIPTTFLIDQQGRIASVHVGLSSKSNYENEIEQLLSDSRSDAANSAVSGADWAAVRPK